MKRRKFLSYFKNNSEYVWYVCYGSNLSRDRFLAYIQGGKVKGNYIKEKGCRDKTLPIKEKNITINNELYFSSKSLKWNNQGVAFVNPVSDSRVKTLAKAYLITMEQFIDVTNQENGNSLKPKAIKRAVRKSLSLGNANINNTSKYGKILYLGQSESYPMFTFTSLKMEEPIAPSCKYLKMISSGLKDSYGLELPEICEYFNKAKGVNYSPETLETLLKEPVSYSYDHYNYYDDEDWYNDYDYRTRCLDYGYDDYNYEDDYKEDEHYDKEYSRYDDFDLDEYERWYYKEMYKRGVDI